MYDKKMIRDIIGKMVNHIGHETFSVKNGEEDLKIL